MPRKKHLGASHALPDEDFTTEVIALYKFAIARGNAPQKPDHCEDLDVRRVAFGLAAINQLLAREVEPFKRAPVGDALTATGIADALHLIDALISGHAHPVHRYVNGLHSQRFRTNVAPPNSYDLLARAIVVGAVRALERNGTSKSTALRLASEQLSGDRVLGVEQIKGWDRRLGQDDPQTQAACNDLVAASERSLSTQPQEVRILAVAQQWLSAFWITPRLP